MVKVIITMLFSLLMSAACASTEVCDEGEAVCLSKTTVFDTNDIAMLSVVKPHAKIVLSDSAISKFVTVEILNRNELELSELHNKYAISKKTKIISSQEIEFAGGNATQTHAQKTVMGQKYDYLIVDFISGNYYFVITGWTNDDNFVEFKDDIVKTINTFRFNDRKALPKVAIDPY